MLEQEQAEHELDQRLEALSDDQFVRLVMAIRSDVDCSGEDEAYGAIGEAWRLG